MKLLRKILSKKIQKISEMNKEQLMRFAKVHNINTKSAKNVAEARRIIQRAVKEAKL